VIGFALVAIIGILPQGMNVQKDNREDTVISQDAPYFLNAIRNGEMRTNNSYLTNYVEEIIVTNITGYGTVTNIYVHTNPQFTNGGDLLLSNDMNIIGLLTLPETDPRVLSVFGTGTPGTPSLIEGVGVTNQVTAYVHAMSGSALQQNHANSAMAFRYQVNVEINPWNNGNQAFYTPLVNLYDAAPNPAMVANYANYMQNMLHEVKLKFLWPILPNGNIGEGRQTYRSLVNAHLYVTNVLGGMETMCFFQPSLYSTNTNSY
jgi:hypothetical protein